MSTITVLHIAAHLGGGVGRALSQLARYRRSVDSRIEDVFVCLELPRTVLYADVIANCGARLFVAPHAEELDALVAEADIVQLEWWHHPLLAGWMSRCKIPPSRLVVWAHVSGLHYPVIPAAFSRLPFAFLLTSKVSLFELVQDGKPRQNILEVVNSTGGFDDLPLRRRETYTEPKFGYLGSLNPAKLHPDIDSYLDAVDLPGFSVDFYGDASTNPRLCSRMKKAGPEPRFVLRGYTDRPGEALASMDVLVYLLNPMHYGTTENALLEAMACGVVPVVLDNPVEKAIVENGKTGLVVDSPRSFAEAIAFIHADPQERTRLSAASAAMVREQYSVRDSAEQLESVYLRVMDQPKKAFDFGPVFGNSPADWFMSCLGRYSRIFADPRGVGGHETRRCHQLLYEKSKSSAFQFSSYFPKDPQLADWAAMLEQDLIEMQGA
jgi:glycosyltransferase involved in cell wall biosynthesis